MRRIILLSFESQRLSVLEFDPKPDQTKFFPNITVNPTSQNAVCLHWLMSMAHFHDKDECQVKVRWTKFAGFARHPRCSERCVVSVMWRSRPLWDLSRNFVWLSPLSSLSLCLLSPVFPRFLFTFKCAVIPPSALHPTPPNPPRSHDRGGGEGVLCCGRPVYAIPLVLKWQARDRYAILKRGLMNFWHLISCFPVNISWLAGAWSAPPGPLWSAGQKKKGPAATSNVFPSNVSSNHSTKVN